MKRIKAMNGYTIMQVTARDEKQGNGTAGEFAIYFSSDIRDYGISNSDAEWDGIDSLEVALELVGAEDAKQFAEAKEELEQEYTAVSYEMIQERIEEKQKEADTFATIREKADSMTRRSAWSKGVNSYAHDLIDTLEEAVDGGWFDMDDLKAPKMVEKALLNGAADWNQYSWGGSSLIYDGDIARRLCNPSELKRTDNGNRRPNAREEWLDTQARALGQAAYIVKTAVRKAVEA